MAVGTFDRLRAIEREQTLPLMRCKALIRRSKERALERLAQITGKVAKPQCVVWHHVAGKRADEWTQTAADVAVERNRSRNLIGVQKGWIDLTVEGMDTEVKHLEDVDGEAEGIRGWGEDGLAGDIR